MRVFVTGATGFIGSTVVTDLIAAGHQVLGLARSDAGADALAAAGAQVQRGDLEDLDSLRRGAAAADGVIHTAFIHDFTRFAHNSEIDRRAIEALGAALHGSARPLVVTAGIFPTPGRPTTEDDLPPSGQRLTPRVSEETALALAERGLRVSVLRLPQVHDRRRQGLVTSLFAIARAKGVAAYLGDGLNRWAAVPRADVAALYRLALEKGAVGARYHAVAEEGVAMREIVQAIGRRLGVAVESLSAQQAGDYFGPFAGFAGMANPASSVLTRQRLGWRLGQHPGLIADLDTAEFDD